MTHKLIFIEGISGVGKSTTATLLCNKLRAMAHPVACYLEGNPANPLDPFDGTYPPEMSLAAFSQTYLCCWQHFMYTPQTHALILDGTLLHHQINDLIRNYDASNQTVLNHLAPLLQTVHSLHPIVFYISSSSVAQRLIHAQKSRQKPAPTAEQIAFWQHRKQADLHALKALSIPSHFLAVDDGWGMVIETITQYVVPH